MDNQLLSLIEELISHAQAGESSNQEWRVRFNNRFQEAFEDAVEKAVAKAIKNGGLGNSSQDAAYVSMYGGQ